MNLECALLLRCEASGCFGISEDDCAIVEGEVEGLGRVGKVVIMNEGTKSRTPGAVWRMGRDVRESCLIWMTWRPG
jgi:hypothetical protein